MTSIGQGRFLWLVEDGGWEYVMRRNVGPNGVVAVVAMTDERKLLLVEQFRKPVGKWVIDIPAGLVDDRETVSKAAARELLEETGYSGSPISVLGAVPTSPGLTNEVVTIVWAGNTTKTNDVVGVDGEAITVHEISIPGLRSWLTAKMFQGCLIDPKVYTGLVLARLYSPRL